MLWFIVIAALALIIYFLISYGKRDQDESAENREMNADYLSHGTRKNIEDPKKL